MQNQLTLQLRKIADPSGLPYGVTDSLHLDGNPLLLLLDLVAV